MTRLNLLLLGILIVCALGTVTSQYRARQLYAELQHEQEDAKQMNTEFGQLQLEQSTWAMHQRVEKIAGEKLNMHVPDAKQIQIVPVAPTVEANKS
jgi:cell division protein FtsL